MNFFRWFIGLFRERPRGFTTITIEGGLKRPVRKGQAMTALGQIVPPRNVEYYMSASMESSRICEHCLGTGTEAYRTGFFLLDIAFRPCTNIECEGRGEWIDSFRIL